MLLAGAMFSVFGSGNSGQDLESKLAARTVTTITNTSSRNITIASGEATVIRGAGRVTGNITVQPGGLLVVESNPGALNSGAAAVQGIINVQGGEFYMLSGGIWHSNLAYANSPPIVVITGGGSFTMEGGLIRSRVNRRGAFAVDVVDGTFTMNGGTIIGPNGVVRNSDPAVRVNANGVFIMNNGNIHGDEVLTTTHGTRGVHVNGGTAVMHNGLIRGYINNNRPAVHVTSGTFTQYGGSIQQGNASNAIGVRVDGGTFYMNGGEVRNRLNNNKGTGVNVRLNGTFVQHGGDVHTSNNGVVVTGQNARFIMHGGNVRNNEAKSGAGVDVAGRANFTMYGGYISHNRVTGLGRGNGGGGVQVSDAGTTFVMNGGNIVNNRAPIKRGGHGGGVNVRESARFYMNGGLIAYNEAGSGGGVIVTSNARQNTYMRLDGGTIRNNEATKGELSHGGGGVNVYAHKNGVSTLDMYSGYILNNRSSSRGGGSGKLGVGGGGVAVGTNNTKGENATITARATFNMYGGTIAGNDASCDRTKRISDKRVTGGGVIAYRRGSFINMYGGVIEHNTSVAGGGVSLFNSAQFNMHSGYIRYNEATGGYFARTKKPNSIAYDLEIRGGGGVYLHNESVKSTGGNRPTFNMFGGSIINNVSPEGGGIFWMSILDKATRHTERHLANYQVRESTLTRVYISADAVVRNNIALNGTRIDDALWGRHRAEDPTVNWGGRVVTRSVPAPEGGQFLHLFNNHDILTWGQGNTPMPTFPYNVTFINTLQGYFNGEHATNVTLTLNSGDVVADHMVPNVDAIWGWEFVGWTYDFAGTSPANPDGHVVAGNINFYAQFQRRYFRATFTTDGNGFLVDSTFYIDIPFEGVVTLDMMPAVVGNHGYILSHWSPDPVAGHVMVDDVLFTASFARTHVNLTFNVNYDHAGLLNWLNHVILDAAIGTPFTLVPDVIIIDADYEFIGWYEFDPMGYEPSHAQGDRTFTAIFARINP